MCVCVFVALAESSLTSDSCVPLSWRGGNPLKETLGQYADIAQTENET